MPYQPTLNFKLSDGTDLGNLNPPWITKEYLMTVYPQIGNQLITPELWVWGQNITYGAIGDNTTTDRSTPVTTLAGGANWKQVSSGGNHVIGIKNDGTLWTWGRNSRGQLGTGTAVDRLTPVTTFAGGTNWKQVAGTDQISFGIKTDGTLWTWGYNLQNTLGNNTSNNCSTPVTTFAGGTEWKQVAAGGYAAAAIKTDGTLWVWGKNYTTGQLGINNASNTPATPVTTFAGGTNWKQVACGGNFMSAIKTDGTLWTWGVNAYGQLGINSTTGPICTPVTTFAGGTNWKQVACGGGPNVIAIKTDGTLWCWGRNNTGSIGDNTATNRLTPVTTFAGGTNWKQSSANGAIKSDGSLWMWGGNGSGQLGDNTTTTRSTPVTTFAGGTNWKQFTGGSATTYAIRTSDDLQGI